MQILFFDMGSYMYNDIMYTLDSMGHSVRTVYYKFKDRCNDLFFEERFREKLCSQNFDLVFSVNFFPLVAIACKEKEIPYISWSCDSPLSDDLEKYFEMDTNFIYLFDRYEVDTYVAKGYTRVFHLPLATNAERLSRLSFSQELVSKGTCDISFVGQLYKEPILSNLEYGMDEYSKGFIDGALNTQLNVYGSDLLESLITQEFVDSINDQYRKQGLNGTLGRNGLKFAIQKQITFAERVALLGLFGEYFDTKYFNTYDYDFGSSVKFMGPVKYMTEMPAVFRYSKLNLCPTIRSIVSGIPLRALDIMGSGGVLFANYQIELAENFIDGQDLILYSSLEEAYDKASFYLDNPDLIKSIAESGFEKVKEAFNYKDKLDILLDIKK